jgi:predicted PurR-regulated permease PerM
MKESNLNMYLFLFLLLIAGGGVFLIFQPFLSSIVFAAIFAVQFRNINRSLREVMFGNSIAASLIVCLLIAVLIVTPVSIVIGFAVNESASFYHSEQSGAVFEKVTMFVEQSPLLHKVFPGADFSTRFAESFRTVSTGAVGIIGAAYQGVAQFVLWLFVLFFTLFYFLVDGESILRNAKRFSPLQDSQDTLLFQKFISISGAMIKGTLVVGLVQGILAGIVLSIAGVQSPVILGIIAALASLIPGVGTALVWFPAGIVLIAAGNIWQGVFVLSFGLGVISMIDNILRPKLVGRDTEMHPLLIFFATLGGIGLFGLPGLLIGPIVVSLFFALADIYASEYGAKKENGNGSLLSS